MGGDIAIESESGATLFPDTDLALIGTFITDLDRLARKLGLRPLGRCGLLRGSSSLTTTGELRRTARGLRSALRRKAPVVFRQILLRDDIDRIREELAGLIKSLAELPAGDTGVRLVWTDGGGGEGPRTRRRTRRRRLPPLRAAAAQTPEEMIAGARQVFERYRMLTDELSPRLADLYALDATFTSVGHHSDGRITRTPMSTVFMLTAIRDPDARMSRPFRASEPAYEMTPTGVLASFTEKYGRGSHDPTPMRLLIAWTGQAWRIIAKEWDIFYR